jgi:radical SAM superfamily enzyme YgiQ (UPF0313 family)
MGHRIVLTADKTLMSSYNGSMFVGFAACFPRVLPKWLYTRLFCPSQNGRSNTVDQAPGGLRKIEAALIEAGIRAEEIAVAHPDKLDRVVDSSTKVIGITTSDPLGLAPASSTFSSLLRKESYTAFFFRSLMQNPVLRASGAKIIVGGPGAWQLQGEITRRIMGIDCLVEGEGELLAPGLFKDALEGRPIAPRVFGGTVPVNQIPVIRNATVNGNVEISRGCGRGCDFCSPNMRTVRHMPLERIMEEVSINLRSCDRITLHAEDVLRYKAKGMVPDRTAVADLFEKVVAKCNHICLSHLALSSALACPGLIEDISHITGADSGKMNIYGQTGIETGSPALVSKHMKGKAKPFQPENWPEVVKESFKLLQDNHWVPCGTLVLGLPGERAHDIEMTTDLVRDLRPYKSLIVPLFFVPLGEMKEDGFFRAEAMLPEHWILLGECIEHDFLWAPDLMEELFSQDKLSATKAAGFKLANWYMQRKVRKYLETMKGGEDPRDVAPPLGIQSMAFDRPKIEA